MKTFRKVVAVVLVLCMAAAMAGCGAQTEPQKAEPVADQPAQTEQTSQPSQSSQTEQTQPPAETNDGISPELKAFLESYEAFMDEYCAFMANYNASDLTQLMKYAELMAKYSDFAAKAEKWSGRDMNEAETLYYLEVMNRVNAKLLKTTQQ